MNLMWLHSIAAASLLSYAVAVEPPRAEIYPQVQTPFPNRSVAMVCFIFGMTNPRTEWRRKGEWNTLHDENYDVTDNFQGSVLRILEMRESDYGTYECSATDKYGHWEETTAEIKKPAWDRFGESFSFPSTEGLNVGELKVKEGHTVHLTCYHYSMGKATVMWFKDMIPQNMIYKPRHYVKDGGKHLKISDFQEDDEGTYSCMASISFVHEGTLFQDIGKLYLAEPIEMFPPAQTVANGGTALITCIVTSKENDWRIKWYKNGKNLKSKRYHVIDRSKGSTLRIEHVSAKRDEATYECIAENGDETIERGLAVLTVQSELRLPDGFPRFVQQPNNQTTADDEVAMTCDAVGNPRPEIIWFKDNAPVNISDNPFTEDPNDERDWFERYQTYESNRVLKKFGVEVSDEGVYECMAINSHGSAISNKGYLHVTN